MEFLNIQAGDKKDQVIDAVESMATLRGVRCKAEELVVVKTDDPQLADAIVKLLGPKRVSRHHAAVHQIEEPKETLTISLTPGSVSEDIAYETADVAGPAPENTQSHQRKITDAEGHRICPRCWVDGGKKTRLEPYKQLCPEHRVINPATKKV